MFGQPDILNEHPTASSRVSKTERIKSSVTGDRVLDPLLICSGPHGHFFEVTKAGEVVWEYINPVGNNSTDKPGIFNVMTDEPSGHYSSVFRAHRYARPLNSFIYNSLLPRELRAQGKLTFPELFTPQTIIEKYMAKNIHCMAAI